MNKLKVLFGMLIVMLGVGFATTTAEAREIKSDSPSLVDDVKFLTDTLNQGEISSMTVSFSEKKGKELQPGDTLTLALPDGIKGMQNDGQPATIQLKNAAGVVFGNVVISEGQAVVTFTDAVTKLDNVRGHFNIAIIAKNEGRETDLKVTPLNLGLPEKNGAGQPIVKQGLTIRGIQKYVETAPEGEFDYRKAGDMVTGVGNVRWFINVNERQKKVSKFATDIVIKDTLGPGQKFKPGSFMVSRTKWNDTLKKNETSWVSIPELEAAGWVKVVKDPSVDGKSFEIILNVEDPKWTAELSGQSFALSYITDVTDPSLKVFTNNLDMSYQIDGQNPVKENKNYETQNIRLDGAADGDASNPPLTLNEFQENVVEEIVEEIKPIPDVPTDKATEGTEKDNTGKVTETKPPLVLNEGQLIEETLTDEQLEILDDVIQEHIDGHLEDGHTHLIEIDGKPEILTDKEIIEKLLTPDQQKKLKKVIEKHADLSGKKNAPKKTESKKSEKKATKKSDKKKSEALPETGYNNNMWLAVAGVLVAGAGVFVLAKSRKRNND